MNLNTLSLSPEPTQCLVQSRSQVRRWTDEEGLEQEFEAGDGGYCKASAVYFCKEASSTAITPVCVTHSETWTRHNEYAQIIGIVMYLMNEETP